MKSLETKWKPVSHLTGYEQRINEDGYLETRYAEPSAPVVVPEEEIRKLKEKLAWSIADRESLNQKLEKVENQLEVSIRRAELSAHPSPLPVGGLSIEIRKQLWLTHGCSFHCLYGDDGEMQCNRKPFIDFKRDDEAVILAGIQKHNAARFAELQGKENAK